MTTISNLPTSIAGLSSISALHFIVLTLFVFRVTRALVYDEIFSPVRELIWSKKSPEDSYIGFFFTCHWCVSLWVALPVVIFYAAFPSITFLVGCIFALSGLVGLITARIDQE